MSNNYPVIEKARAWFYRQPSAQQKKIKKYGAISAFCLIFLGAYYLTGQNDKKPRVQEVAKDVTPQKTESTIQDDIVTTLSGEIKQQGATIDQKVQNAVAAAISKGQFSLPSPDQVGAGSGAATPSDTAQPTANAAQPTGAAQSNAASPEYPSMASYPAPTGNGGLDEAQPEQAAAQVETQWLGGISEGNGDIKLNEPAAETSAKKDTIQLPVGFMKAKLLVGVNALTGEFGAENPQTLMFRVQAPAQLPNFIKMNLRGCFNISNVSGNLSSERIIVLPVSIHCMTMDGRYIVEGQVKGFVSDRDGKRDMSARVVSRAGRLLAGTVLAKSVEAFANVIGNQSIQQNVSPLGSINTIKPDEAVKNGAATGVAGGFTEVSKYLLNLAQQTSPALETGPGKDVMLFIQETAELTIKEVRIK
ncbi:conjugal transfer protein TraB [Salmonella enterica]|nr:conjugal transfer protein TraB [Salmonella enterica]